jgi:hypothetical protein
MKGKIYINPFVTSGLKKTLCKWEIYVPLVTKGLIYIFPFIFFAHKHFPTVGGRTTHPPLATPLHGLSPYIVQHGFWSGEGFHPWKTDGRQNEFSDCGGRVAADLGMTF